MNIADLVTGPLFFLFITGFAFLLVYLAIPSIIHVADQRQLFDNNDLQRKSHRSGISRLGGVAVFCSLILTTLLFSNFLHFETSNFIITAFILIFAVGLKDDLWGVNPSTKFFMQLFSALIVVFLADIRISDLHGIFGIHALPYWISVIFTTILIIFITNSFNLIDGIDGLVGITGIIVSFSFGILLAVTGLYAYACLAFTVTGASFGFLLFNISPARIFMGDAGSMLIGLVTSIIAIKFIEANIASISFPAKFTSAPAIAIAILIGPIFDVLRVFIIRILKRSSPFIADLNHTHHRLLRLGLNHFQTTFILISFNNFLIAGVICFRDWGNMMLIGLMFSFCVLFNATLTYLIHIQDRRIYKTALQTQLIQS